jgi:hypothetical protein
VLSNFCYCDFPRFELKFELKFREAKALLKTSRIRLKYLEVLEKYEIWPKILSSHLVACKNISRIYCYREF